MFEREDWWLFRNLGTIGQKAGVPLRDLAALTLKELADNALDAGASVTVTNEGDGWFVVADNGPGIQGGEAVIARLFSIKRPLTSSKLLRKPTRGALGNGLRVVTGVVLASRGGLWVETGNTRYVLTPHDDGSTGVCSAPVNCPVGTRVGVYFGPALAVPADVLNWANIASALKDLGKNYTGKTSCFWYDSSSFYELLMSAGGASVLEVLTNFREMKKGVLPESFKDCPAQSVTRDYAHKLLSHVREHSTPAKASVLGKLGALESFSHAHTYDLLKLGGEGELKAELPYSIEAWVKAAPDDGRDSVTVLVNRTPITREVDCQRQKSHKLGLIGCGLQHLIDAGRKPVKVILNITIPYMPITSDGKAPDLYPFVQAIAHVVETAARRAKRTQKADNGPAVTQRQIVEDNLEEAIAKTSGNGQFRYSLRQLYYALRPYMLESLGKEPDYNYFAQVITDIEARDGADLPGLYRDARGVIYHPHTGEEIPLGTLNVETYERPSWSFNKILYCEKEGLLSILKAVKWPERNDCALLSSKGFASRAARDVLDLIGDSQEEIFFFCIHDADASGTLIYQALTEGTRARGARKVHVINLGLDPWEALTMGLQVETFRSEGDTVRKMSRRLPVADYVPAEWGKWLQTRRVELNAMDSPTFLSWLDAKFSTYAPKVVPPKAVLHDQMSEAVTDALRQRLAAKILAEAGFEKQLLELVSASEPEQAKLDLDTVVRDGLRERPELRWTSPVDTAAASIAEQLI